ncbi:hypothetical protein [Larkinella knui]|uniref:Uncharacterized protein n=1 Tax=Larkinella knui TaxID=2025310 RepID=A0A3P1CD89_9BACT|nr:hypothetical protein [Larkinella knui]RRB10804.1 hypothetical protein EHT87_27020 [Larkinella knui]
MKTKVLITVTTYPLPSRSYDELVCTAGILEDGSWIRIYPVPLKFLLKSDAHKYHWIELELQKPRRQDFRPESHSPVHPDLSDMIVGEKIGTEKNWIRRKVFCLQDVHKNMTRLIQLSKEPSNKSLATFKPARIISFDIEQDDRNWKTEWLEQMKQLNLFTGDQDRRSLIRKIPYKFFYKFCDEAGKISRLMIEDWEIGQLYWNCLHRADGDEQAALQKVREKYNETFINNRDIYLFLGTTKEWHMRRAPNPFVIIGIFYPMNDSLQPQLSLF